MGGIRNIEEGTSLDGQTHGGDIQLKNASHHSDERSKGST